MPTMIYVPAINVLKRAHTCVCVSGGSNFLSYSEALIRFSLILRSSHTFFCHTQKLSYVKSNLLSYVHAYERALVIQSNLLSLV